MEKMKYVKIGTYNSIVIFPTIIEHSAFKHLNPITGSGLPKCHISETSDLSRNFLVAFWQTAVMRMCRLV